MARGLVDGSSCKGSGAVHLVANLLRRLPADPHREPLVLRVALLAGHVLALGQWLGLADLVGHGDAGLLRDGHALLLGDVVALLVGDLLGVGLLHVPALVIGNVLAGSLDGSPHLVVAMTPPLVLAVLFVLGRALRLSVGLVLGPELLDADVLVDGAALLDVVGGTLLPSGGLAQSLGSRLTLLLVNRLAHLLLALLVLCVPKRHVFCPTLDAGRRDLFCRTNMGGCAIVCSWGGKGQ